MAELDDPPEPILPAMTRAQKDEHRQRARDWIADQRRLAERIIVNPKKLGGVPHVRGTKITVAEVRAAWAEPGVYSAEVMKRFPKLKPDDLAAVLAQGKGPPLKPREEALRSYVAEWAGPPHRKLYLEKWPTRGDPAKPTLWRLDVTEFDDDGEELHLSDEVDDTFAQIVRYIDRYAPRDIIWREKATDRIIDIYSHEVD